MDISGSIIDREQLLNFQMTNPDKEPNADKGFYQPYADFAKTLRTWFIAYGIGVPVILLTSKNAWDLVEHSGLSRCIALCFLFGVAAQVLLAIMYKYAMWNLYMGEMIPDLKRKTLFKASNRLSEAVWLEVLIDLMTLVAFTYGTWLALNAITVTTY